MLSSCTCLFLLLCSGLASATTEPAFSKGTATAGELTLPYRLLSPAEIEEGKKYPLVLFLHGAGERGDDNERQLIYLPQQMAKPGMREQFPCFFLAPQCPKGVWWNGAPLRAVIVALEEIVRTQPVDLDRIYLTGLSMGGYGSWDLGSAHADWFAAVSPICGGGDEKRLHRLIDVPVWAVHGADDSVVRPEESRTLIEALKTLGGSPRYDELPKVGHNSWRHAYQSDQGIGWLFEQRRDHQRNGGISLLTGPATPFRKSEKSKTPLKIVFFGDSITEAAVQRKGYIHRLDSAISDEHVQFIGAGISGHKVPDLQKRLERDVLSHDPDLVFIYIGINDVWHSQHGQGTPQEQFEAGLRDLIAKIEAQGARVILATPTVIGEKRSNALDPMLEEYATISRQVAQDTGVHLCDLREASRSYLRICNPDDLEKGILTTDGVHLNEAGNRFVANEAAFALFELLREEE